MAETPPPSDILSSSFRSCSTSRHIFCSRTIAGGSIAVVVSSLISRHCSTSFSVAQWRILGQNIDQRLGIIRNRFLCGDQQVLGTHRFSIEVLIAVAVLL